MRRWRRCCANTSRTRRASAPGAHHLGAALGASALILSRGRSSGPMPRGSERSRPGEVCRGAPGRGRARPISSRRARAPAERLAPGSARRRRASMRFADPLLLLLLLLPARLRRSGRGSEGAEAPRSTSGFPALALPCRSQPSPAGAMAAAAGGPARWRAGAPDRGPGPAAAAARRPGDPAALAQHHGRAGYLEQHEGRRLPARQPAGGGPASARRVRAAAHRATSSAW